MQLTHRQHTLSQASLWSRYTCGQIFIPSRLHTPAEIAYAAPKVLTELKKHNDAEKNKA